MTFSHIIECLRINETYFYNTIVILLFAVYGLHDTKMVGNTLSTIIDAAIQASAIELIWEGRPNKGSIKHIRN